MDKLKQDQPMTEANKLIVMVDWHNVIEVNDQVPQKSFDALMLLLGKAKVFVCSSVVTAHKKQDVRKFCLDGKGAADGARAGGCRTPPYHCV